MKQWSDLTEDEQMTANRTGNMWYLQHRQHVEHLMVIGKTKPCIAPSGSDMFHPELWKAIHWNWFFDTKGKP